MRTVIIGAGLAGLACAEQLAQAGVDATLFDKGRAPGGRMSTRRVPAGGGSFAFDHGAQYFTARDPLFRAEVAQWHRRGLAAPWPAAGDDAWVGTPGMSGPVTALAAARDVRFSHHVMGLVREGGGRGGAWWVNLQGGERQGPFDAVVIALPAEQALAFLGAHDLAMASRAVSARSQPCWTAMAAFPARLPLPDVIRDAGTLAWAARDGAKPGRDGSETWVLQAGGMWSARHLERTPGEIAQLLLAELTGLCAPASVPEPTYLAAHRWRYAMTSGAALGALWNPSLQLGACGDWLMGPRVELAWLSGRHLARAMLAGHAGLQAAASHG
jgi:predicted NAD/FAD-dependent oxidoreductase